MKWIKFSFSICYRLDVFDLYMTLLPELDPAPQHISLPTNEPELYRILKQYDDHRPPAQPWTVVNITSLSSVLSVSCLPCSGGVDKR